MPGYQAQCQDISMEDMSARKRRKKIREIIEKTGYRPSIQARNLRTRQTRLVGVVVPKISSETISRVTDGIGKILQEKGYQMLLATTDNNPEKRAGIYGAV